MKKLLFLTLLIAGCGGGPGTTPDSVAQTLGCFNGYACGTYGYVCQVVFDDGQRGYTVSGFGGGEMCKGVGGL
jgi:hypothetical protein